MIELNGTIEVGAIAPDFTLQANTGDTMRLSDFRSSKHILLYFMREFMCMQCQNHVARLGQDYEKIQAMNAEVLVVGSGQPMQADRLAKSFNLPFPVLADPDRSVYHTYGLDRVRFFMQRSGNFIIDKDGALRHIHQVTNPQASINHTAILQELGKLA